MVKTQKNPNSLNNLKSTNKIVGLDSRIGDILSLKSINLADIMLYYNIITQKTQIQILNNKFWRYGEEVVRKYIGKAVMHKHKSLNKKEAISDYKKCYNQIRKLENKKSKAESKLLSEKEEKHLSDLKKELDYLQKTLKTFQKAPSFEEISTMQYKAINNALNRLDRLTKAKIPSLISYAFCLDINLSDLDWTCSKTQFCDCKKICSYRKKEIKVMLISEIKKALTNKKFNLVKKQKLVFNIKSKKLLAEVPKSKMVDEKTLLKNIGAYSDYLSLDKQDKRTFDKKGNQILAESFDQSLIKSFNDQIELNRVIKSLEKPVKTPREVYYAFQSPLRRLNSNWIEEPIEDTILISKKVEELKVLEKDVIHTNIYKFESPIQTYGYYQSPYSEEPLTIYGYNGKYREVTYRKELIYPSVYQKITIHKGIRFLEKSITSKDWLSSLKPTYYCKSGKDIISNGDWIYEVDLNYDQVQKIQSNYNLKTKAIDSLIKRKKELEDTLTNKMEIHEYIRLKEKTDREIYRINQKLSRLMRNNIYFEVLYPINKISPDFERLMVKYQFKSKSEIEEDLSVDSFILSELLRKEKEIYRFPYNHIINEGEDFKDLVDPFEIKKAIRKVQDRIKKHQIALSEDILQLEDINEALVDKSQIKYMYKCRTNIGINAYSDLGEYFVHSKLFKSDTSMLSKYEDPSEKPSELYQIPIKDNTLSGEYTLDNLIKQKWEYNQIKVELQRLVIAKFGYVKVGDDTYLLEGEGKDFLDVLNDRIKGIDVMKDRLNINEEQKSFEERFYNIHNLKLLRESIIGKDENMYIVNMDFIFDEIRKYKSLVKDISLSIRKMVEKIPRLLLDEQINKGDKDNNIRSWREFISQLGIHKSLFIQNISVHGKVYTKTKSADSNAKYIKKVGALWDLFEDDCRLARFYPKGKNSRLRFGESKRNLLNYCIQSIREEIYYAIISDNSQLEEKWIKWLDYIYKYEDLIIGEADPSKHLTLKPLNEPIFDSFLKCMELIGILEEKWNYGYIALSKKPTNKEIARKGKITRRLQKLGEKTESIRVYNGGWNDQKEIASDVTFFIYKPSISKAIKAVMK